MNKSWLREMVEDLALAHANGEIVLQQEHGEFLSQISKWANEYGDPSEEMTEKQIKYVRWLHEGYLNENWERWDEFE